jgi:hypothetical protein
MVTDVKRPIFHFDIQIASGRPATVKFWPTVKFQLVILMPILYYISGYTGKPERVYRCNGEQ